jgi:hypothetical protein
VLYSLVVIDFEGYGLLICLSVETNYEKGDIKAFYKIYHRCIPYEKCIKFLLLQTFFYLRPSCKTVLINII